MIMVHAEAMNITNFVYQHIDVAVHFCGLIKRHPVTLSIDRYLPLSKRRAGINALKGFVWSVKKNKEIISGVCPVDRVA